MGIFSSIQDWFNNLCNHNNITPESALAQAKKDQKYRNKQEKIAQLKKRAVYNFEYPQLEKIIKESTDIILNTKKIDTAVTRFKTIQECYSRILSIVPDDIAIYVEIGEWAPFTEISTQDALDIHITSGITNYIRDHFKNRISEECIKAECLTDEKLKNEQYKKALRIALQGITHIPNDQYMKEIVLSIESKIVAISKPKKSKNTGDEQ